MPRPSRKRPNITPHSPPPPTPPHHHQLLVQLQPPPPGGAGEVVVRRHRRALVAHADSHVDLAKGCVCGKVSMNSATRHKRSAGQLAYAEGLQKQGPKTSPARWTPGHLGALLLVEGHAPGQRLVHDHAEGVHVRGLGRSRRPGQPGPGWIKSAGRLPRRGLAAEKGAGVKRGAGSHPPPTLHSSLLFMTSGATQRGCVPRVTLI